MLPGEYPPCLYELSRRATLGYGLFHQATLGKPYYICIGVFMSLLRELLSHLYGLLRRSVLWEAYCICISFPIELLWGSPTVLVWTSPLRFAREHPPYLYRLPHRTVLGKSYRVCVTDQGARGRRQGLDPGNITFYIERVHPLWITLFSRYLI